jgi:hypothetical protein
MVNHYSENVFINCPYDDNYQPFFNAIIFTVFDCGFTSRCAKEEQDASQIRLEKIFKIVENSKYAIHDISRTELDPSTNLPRFNMPLELGLFLSAKRFGIKNQKSKKCLIMDTDKFRYQSFISDISGQDVDAHGNDINKMIVIVRNWLQAASGRKTIPSGSIISQEYATFSNDLPVICNQFRLNPNDLTFNDFTLLVTEWLKAQDQLKN